MNSYLSVVAVSRNDDHGGDPLIRTQIFIDNLARQSEEFKLHLEIIIVDWNPVPGRLGLAEVLNIPAGLQYVSTRVITVPASIHSSFKSANNLHLFQMIGKNVGIRRAQGDFILATNIDVLFSNELMSFLAKKKLKKDKTYRVDRFDIKSGIQVGLVPSAVLDYAWNNPIRENKRFKPIELLNLYSDEKIFNQFIDPNELNLSSSEYFDLSKEDDVWQFKPNSKADISYLHTNACGDFTLISREGWGVVGGYPEFEGYSFNIDSMGLIAAHYSGFTEISLLPPMVCFHIEHSIGSGWTPEGEKKLFDRMRKNGITSPEWPVLMPLVESLKNKGRDFQLNDPHWGLINFELPESSFGKKDPYFENKISKINDQLKKYRVGAIKPEYDLDRITLLHELTVKDKVKSENPWIFNKNKGVEAQLFISDEYGNFSELDSLKRIIPIKFNGNISFTIKNFSSNQKLRFDPMNTRGLIKIKSLLILNQETEKSILINNISKLHSLFKPLNDVFLLKSEEGLIVFATGEDPQLLLKSNIIKNSVFLTLIFEVEFPELIH